MRYGTAISNGNRDVIGRVVQINKHPFTIVGVAQADFRGATELFFAAGPSWAPIVNLSQVSGGDYPRRTRQSFLRGSSAV